MMRSRYVFAAASIGVMACAGAPTPVTRASPPPGDAGAQAETPPTTNTPPPSSMHRLAVGSAHACVILSDRRVACWGDDTEGAVSGTPGGGAAAPMVVSGLADVIEIAASGTTTCALIKDGTVSCWGRVIGARRGDLRAAPPRAVPSLAGVERIAVGSATVCGLAKGNVRCIGPSEVLRTPHAEDSVVLDDSGTVTALAGGTGGICVQRPGEVACIGEAIAGSAKEVRVPGGDITSFSVAGETVCVVRSTGALECGRWTEANPRSGARVFAPHTIELGGPARTVASGFAHSCGATTSGSVSCFGGFNTHGELGATTAVSSDAPVRVPSIADAVQLGAGLFFSCALRSGDKVTCWGQAAKGQLGPGGREPGPVDVVLPNARTSAAR